MSNLDTKLKIKSLIKHGYAQTGGSSIDRLYTKGTYQEKIENFKWLNECVKLRKIKDYNIKFYSIEKNCI